MPAVSEKDGIRRGASADDVDETGVAATCLRAAKCLIAQVGKTTGEYSCVGVLEPF